MERFYLEDCIFCFLRISTALFDHFQLLPRLTSKELLNLVTNFAGENATNLTFILDMVSNGISFIGSCAAQYSAMPQANSNAIISCIGQILNNFLIVLQVCSQGIVLFRFFKDKVMASISFFALIF